ncbi:hypothetical protein GN958_ATG20174, partial [Phytophthora infestans]
KTGDVSHEIYQTYHEYIYYSNARQGRCESKAYYLIHNREQYGGTFNEGLYIHPVRAQRFMFEHFPKVLLIDATHDTSSSNYKLFSFMIHDAMGKGQHIVLFQNRWFSDHEQRTFEEDVTVVTGETAYDVDTLKAMRSWHTAASHFDILDEFIKWKKQDTRKGLRNVDMLGDYFWAISLCGKPIIGGPCLDTALKAIVKRNSAKVIIFSIPSDVLRFPQIDADLIKQRAIWKDLENIRSNMDLDKDRLLFLAAKTHGLNHWFTTPPQAGDRFKQLRAYLKSELRSRLPQLGLQRDLNSRDASDSLN